MIVFDLSCAEGHRFEGWFGSSGDFADQQERGLMECPHCGSDEVVKAPMAPAVPRKGNAQLPTSTASTSSAAESGSGSRAESVPVAAGKMPAEVTQALARLAAAQNKALAKSTWVGDKFAEQARAMHYGEREQTAIHGQTSLDEAKSLIDEGVPVAPLPLPVAPPEKIN